jgi:kumamolisin
MEAAGGSWQQSKKPFENWRGTTMQAIRFFMVATFVVAIESAATAAPSVYERAPAAIDLGPAQNFASEASVTVTVALKLRDVDQMQSLLETVYAPGSAQFHQFLRTDEFAARFGPTAETVEAVSNHFRAAGLHVSQNNATHLSITGSPAAMEAEFQVALHVFEVPAVGGRAAYRFHAPTASAQVAPVIADAVQAVIGLDTSPHYRPHLHHLGPAGSGVHMPIAATSGGGGTTNPPGELTVLDFAQYYDVNPLYKRGINGRGVTIGIVTLASFTPSDAFAYWSALGLSVSPNRIREVKVDNGSGPPSDASGSDETTLDVEQAGGLAPASKIIVYESPNSHQGFVDNFAKAIFSNEADTISCSWGEWEWVDLKAQSGSVTDPTNGRQVSTLRAFNDLFIQAALQGQSIYIASGDSGAYDASEFFFPPSYPPPTDSVVLSVDAPASLSWVTAMGGTTLPGTQVYAISATQDISIPIATEQAWGWDYLIPLCTAIGLDPIECGIYPAGSGGGVSAFVPMPFYQLGIPGIRRTEHGQSLLDFSQTPPAPVVTLRGGFAGRNVPDLSVNSDPQTGYLIFYTSDKFGPEILQAGGTSFAAPQFNGVTALFDQSFYGRVGLLNIALYQLVREGRAYGGRDAPLRDITAGDNWHYNGVRGYDQATGVGVPDVANLLKALEGR